MRAGWGAVLSIAISGAIGAGGVAAQTASQVWKADSTAKVAKLAPISVTATRTETSVFRTAMTST